MDEKKEDSITKKKPYQCPERKFDNGKVWKFTAFGYASFPISLFIWNFGPDQTKTYDQEIFKTIPDTNWIVGIRYQNLAGRLLGGVDAQIGCSGKLYIRETEQQGAVREMGEELGLAPKSQISPQVWKGSNVHTYRNGQQKKIENTVFCYCVSEVEPVTSSRNTGFRADDHNKRVFVLVHGTLDQVKQLLTELKTVRYSKDAPWSVVAIPKEFAVTCVTLKRDKPHLYEPVDL